MTSRTPTPTPRPRPRPRGRVALFAAAVALISFATPTHVFAQAVTEAAREATVRVVLRDGTEVDGVLVDFGARTYHVRKPDGTVEPIRERDVREIRFGGAPSAVADPDAVLVPARTLEVTVDRDGQAWAHGRPVDEAMLAREMTLAGMETAGGDRSRLVVQVSAGDEVLASHVTGLLERWGALGMEHLSIRPGEPAPETALRESRRRLGNGYPEAADDLLSEALRSDPRNLAARRMRVEARAAIAAKVGDAKLLDAALEDYDSVMLATGAHDLGLLEALHRSLTLAQIDKLNGLTPIMMGQVIRAGIEVDDAQVDRWVAAVGADLRGASHIPTLTAESPAWLRAAVRRLANAPDPAVRAVATLELHRVGASVDLVAALAPFDDETAVPGEGSGQLFDPTNGYAIPSTGWEPDRDPVRLVAFRLACSEVDLPVVRRILDRVIRHEPSLAGAVWERCSNEVVDGRRRPIHPGILGRVRAADGLDGLAFDAARGDSREVRAAATKSLGEQLLARFSRKSLGERDDEHAERYRQNLPVLALGTRPEGANALRALLDPRVAPMVRGHAAMILHRGFANERASAAATLRELAASDDEFVQMVGLAMITNLEEPGADTLRTAWEVRAAREEHGAALAWLVAQAGDRSTWTVEALGREVRAALTSKRPAFQALKGLPTVSPLARPVARFRVRPAAGRSERMSEVIVEVERGVAHRLRSAYCSFRSAFVPDGLEVLVRLDAGVAPDAAARELEAILRPHSVAWHGVWTTGVAPESDADAALVCRSTDSSDRPMTYWLDPVPFLRASDFAFARRSESLSLQPRIEMDTATPAARERLAAYTGAHIGRAVALVLDGRVVTAPVIRTAITDGKLEISGSYSKAEVELLLKTLNAERAAHIPVDIELIEIGPERE